MREFYECSKNEVNINELYGIIQSINYDGIINPKEIELLKKWIEDNSLYKQYALFNEIIYSLSKCEDHSIQMKIQFKRNAPTV